MGRIVPPRAAHARVSATVARRSAGSGGPVGAAGAADVEGSATSRGVGGGDWGDASACNADGDASRGVARPIVLPGAGDGCFGAPAHPTSNPITIEHGPRMERGRRMSRLPRKAADKSAGPP